MVTQRLKYHIFVFSTLFINCMTIFKLIFAMIISFHRFSVLLIVYFVGGVLFMKFGKGAEGKETIPNVKLWSDFPFLVKVIINVLFSQTVSYDKNV